MWRRKLNTPNICKNYEILKRKHVKMIFFLFRQEIFFYFTSCCLKVTLNQTKRLPEFSLSFSTIYTLTVQHLKSSKQLYRKLRKVRETFYLNLGGGGGGGWRGGGVNTGGRQIMLQWYLLVQCKLRRIGVPIQGLSSRRFPNHCIVSRILYVCRYL